MSDIARSELIYRMARSEVSSWADDLAAISLSPAEAVTFTALMLGMMMARLIHADYDEKHGADERVIDNALMHVRGHTVIELEILRHKERPTH